jgi:dipeptidyl aminopeptidase/acylaminoacyl peptidase
VTLFWLGLALMCSLPLLLAAWLAFMYGYLRWKYAHLIVRIFQEKPLFILPRGDPLAEAEPVTFRTADGLTLCGCYLATSRRRRGVLLFGLEFGSSRWSCRSYCEHLVANGFDVFAFESRNQGASDSLPGYEPLQWVTDYEVADVRAALAYLKGRPDADPRGVGFFGISKGGGAGLLAAAHDPYVRCCVADGAFATYSTVVPYMRHWFRIYNRDYFLQGLLPSWYYGLVGLSVLRQIERERHCRFPHLEKALRRLTPRPLLLIHGAMDTYIKPEMARALFTGARQPKEFWLVPGAKHNQALQVAGDEYRRRVLEFFTTHLAGSAEPAHRPLGVAEPHTEVSKLVRAT